MNEIEYLKRRISDIETALSKCKCNDKIRKNQAHALLIYRLDLERAIAKNQNCKAD